MKIGRNSYNEIFLTLVQISEELEIQKQRKIDAEMAHQVREIIHVGKTWQLLFIKYVYEHGSNNALKV